MLPPLTPNWICLREVFQGRSWFPMAAVESLRLLLFEQNTVQSWYSG